MDAGTPITRRWLRIGTYAVAGMFGYSEPRIVAASAAAYIVAAFLRDSKIGISE